MVQRKCTRFISEQSAIKKSDEDSIFKLDFAELKKHGFINPAVRRSLISEEVRLIKRRLFQKMSLFDNSLQQDPESISKNAQNNDDNNIDHVVQITSSKPNEGKSFIALNLALSIVMDERYNVLLIDADVTRSSTTKLLGLRNEYGLTDVLRDDKPNLNGVLKRDRNYPLSFLPSGSGVASATDLFGGYKMKNLVNDVAHRYRDRIIIFDTPPLLAGTESVVLSHNVGQVLYVVDGSSTSYNTIEAGLELLDNYDNVSLVLNKAAQFGSLDQFGSYYEYN